VQAVPVLAISAVIEEMVKSENKALSRLACYPRDVRKLRQTSKTKEQKHIKFIQCAALFAIATLAFFAVPSQADGKIPVRVVVITTFQAGKDNDPSAGEFGNWVLKLPLPLTIPFPQGKETGYDTEH
jgi:hypothetical protein